MGPLPERPAVYAAELLGFSENWPVPFAMAEDIAEMKQAIAQRLDEAELRRALARGRTKHLSEFVDAFLSTCVPA